MVLWVADRGYVLEQHPSLIFSPPFFAMFIGMLRYAVMRIYFHIQHAGRLPHTDPGYHRGIKNTAPFIQQESSQDCLWVSVGEMMYHQALKRMQLI